MEIGSLKDYLGKWRPLGWALTNFIGVFIRRGHEDKDTRDKCAQRKDCGGKTARWWPSASQGDRTQEKQTLRRPWSWTSSLQNGEKMNFCCLIQKRKKKKSKEGLHRLTSPGEVYIKVSVNVLRKQIGRIFLERNLIICMKSPKTYNLTFKNLSSENDYGKRKI